VTDLALAKRNILLLAISQALYSCCVITVFATGGLVGLMLAPDPGLTTVPVTAFVLGAALTTIPASLTMQRIGRLPVFLLGAAFCVTGAILSVYAIYTKNFALFCFSTALQGVFQSTSGFYRFAAVEGASGAMKPMAISWVLTGGVVAAVAGTLISSGTSDLLAPFTFAGSYVAVAVIALIAMAVLLLLKLPKPTAEDVHGPRRSWAELLQQPKLIVAMASGTLAYGMMNFMMTAAPVAMVGCGFDQSDASWVIQWHVLAMFVPSFFTGQLIAAYGAPKIAAIGMAILIGAAVIGLSGITFGNFAVALILLGLGWNFGFIGGTTMLTKCYTAPERGKVQGANDFIMSAVVALASFSSGKLWAAAGWSFINIAIFPIALLALLLIIWQSWGSKRPV
jgi:predicted MFS family arabinose efflux permease